MGAINESFEIRLSGDSTSFSAYVFGKVSDSSKRTGGLLIKDNKIEKFLECLNTIKIKYIEWVQTAKSNNVTKADKGFDICSFPNNVGAFFSYGDWQFSQCKPYADFKVFTDSENKTDYMLIVRTGKLVSNTNQFMDVDGINFVFTSVEEVENFINLLSPEKIKAFVSKPKTEELFK
jgi:hypothetical protein